MQFEIDQIAFPPHSFFSPSAADEVWYAHAGFLSCHKADASTTKIRCTHSSRKSVRWNKREIPKRSLRIFGVIGGIRARHKTGWRKKGEGVKGWRSSLQQDYGWIWRNVNTLQLSKADFSRSHYIVCEKERGAVICTVTALYRFRMKHLGLSLQYVLFWIVFCHYYCYLRSIQCFFSPLCFFPSL